MTASTALFIVAASIVLGLTAAVWLIRVLRRQSYRRWPTPFRWAYLTLVAVLVVLGAAILVNAYVLKWGTPAAVWLLAAPALYGLWRVASPSSPASP